MASINSLPEDILKKCLAYVCITSLSSINTSFLKSLSTVCRAWRNPAQTLLFSSVKISQARRLRLFLMHGTRIELTQSVKRLQLLIHGDGGTTTIAPKDMISPSDLAKLLGFLPSIIEIDVTFERTTVLHDATLEMIAFADVRPRALRIQCMSTDSSLVASQLCSVWPSVEHVSLSGNADIVRATGASKPQFELYEYDWRCTRPPSESHLQWMLYNSRRSLQILSLTTLPEDLMLLQMLLQKLRGTLRSVRLPRAPKRLTIAFSNLEKLEEFKLTASIPSLPLLNALPPSVQHLAFGIKPKPSRQSILPGTKFSISSPTSITSPNRPFGSNSPRTSPVQTRSKAAAAIVGPSPNGSTSSEGTLADVIEYVRKAPSLRTVTYSWCTDDGTSDVVALKVLCVERGIDLRCFRHEFGWYSPYEREELIKCSQFPRYVPISKAHARVPSIAYAS
ncbi:F-box-like domain-containing protein [Ceratobasidium sp. AG-Ba]|nr:F-box-like domain-containing protein [Ceratobasidium sp. AG-Ba]